MSTPKLTWGEFKDADGNWLTHLTPREVIASLEAERDALAARLTRLETAGDNLSDELDHDARCSIDVMADQECDCRLRSVWLAWRAARAGEG